jgi:ferredoxin-type protein NapF
VARTVVRYCVLAAAVTMVLQLFAWPQSPLLPPAMSPYVAIGSTIATRSLAIAGLIAWPVLLVVLVRPRWFCRWACPVGLLTERVDRLRSSRGSWSAKVPPLGQWIVLLTLAGACLGYPLLLWMDPLAIFSAFCGLAAQPLRAAALLSGVGLPIVLGLSLLWPGAWCRRICPLGATQDLLSLPRLVLRRRKTGPQARAAGSAPKWARRTVLALGIGAGGAVLARGRARAAGPQPLRPPGAAAESRFTGLCIRCGNCVRACPTGIIHPDLGSQGLAGLLAPVIRFDAAYCKEDCHRCNQVCPSGAIARLSLEAKKRAVIGLAKADMSICLLGQQRECSICLSECPYEAIKILFHDADSSAYLEVDRARCPGCGACQVACPTSPQKAIVVHPCRADYYRPAFSYADSLCKPDPI